MRNFRHYIYLLSIGLILLSGCDEAETLLPGIREDVLSPIVNRIFEVDDVKEDMDLGLADKCSSWSYSNYNISNTSANCRSDVEDFNFGSQLRAIKSKPEIDVKKISLKLIAKLEATEASTFNYPALPSVIIAENKIYTLGRKFVRAFNLNDYTIEFETRLSRPRYDSDAYGGGMSYDEKEIFISTNYKKLFALSSSSGKINWQADLLEASNSSPIINGSIIYVKGLRNGLTAYSVNGGYKLWSKSTIYTSNDFQVTSNLAVQNNANPILDNVVVGYSNGDFLVVRAQTGRSLWEGSLHENARFNQSLLSIVADPIVIDNNLLISGVASPLSLYDINLGQKLWELPVIVLNKIWVTGNVAYALTDESQLIALNHNSGEVYWFNNLEQWYDKKQLKFHFRFGPVLLDGIIYLFDIKGNILRFNAKTGEELERIKSEFHFVNNPIVAKGRIFIATSSGELVVYGSQIDD